MEGLRYTFFVGSSILAMIWMVKPASTFDSWPVSKNCYLCYWTRATLIYIWRMTTVTLRFKGRWASIAPILCLAFKEAFTSEKTLHSGGWWSPPRNRSEPIYITEPGTFNHSQPMKGEGCTTATLRTLVLGLIIQDNTKKWRWCLYLQMYDPITFHLFHRYLSGDAIHFTYLRLSTWHYQTFVNPYQIL